MNLQNNTQMVQQIILRNIEKPQIKSLEEDLLWLCDSFGFSSGRDTENTANRIIVSLLEKLSNDEISSSEVLAEDLDMKISRINHHLRNLNDSGTPLQEKTPDLSEGRQPESCSKGDEEGLGKDT